MTHRIPAAVILLTLCFATGVLAIPATFSVLGYVPGLLVLLGFGALTTCIARCRSRNPFTRGKTNVLFKTMLISCTLYHVRLPDAICRHP